MDRHGPKPYSISSLLLDPPPFSLPTIFNIGHSDKWQLCMRHYYGLFFINILWSVTTSEKGSKLVGIKIFISPLTKIKKQYHIRYLVAYSWHFAGRSSSPRTLRKARWRSTTSCTWSTAVGPRSRCLIRSATSPPSSLSGSAREHRLFRTFVKKFSRILKTLWLKKGQVFITGIVVLFRTA